MIIIIPLEPVTKKNSSQIIKVKGKHILIPSKKFIEYQKNTGWFIGNKKAPIGLLNIKALYYMKYKYNVDITNLHSALHDILVHYKVIEDDSFKYVGATDGSRVYFDAMNPRTEIEITLL